MSPEINVALIFTNAKAVIDIPENEIPPGGDHPDGQTEGAGAQNEQGKRTLLEKVKVIQDAILAS